MRADSSRQTDGRSRVIAIPAIVLALITLLAGCEQVFTWSPFGGLQRNPANMSPEQQVTFAQDALESGDPDAMGDAFELLQDSEDPETQLLAVDLALGAAEIETTLTDLLAATMDEGGDPEQALADALAGLSAEDLAMLDAAGDLLDAAAEEGEPTPEQYAFTAIGLLAVAADEAGGLEELETVDPDSDAAATLDQAIGFLEAASAGLEESGQDADILAGFEDLLG